MDPSLAPDALLDQDDDDVLNLLDQDTSTLNDDEIFRSFEMTTPRSGEDYSTWCLMAAAAATAAHGRIDLLENEDGLIFQDFLNGRTLNPQHSLGLLECGCGTNNNNNNNNNNTEENDAPTLSHIALGARLILGTKCLDLAEVLSKAPTAYAKVWDLLCPPSFQSKRHAHFALWMLTEIAEKEKQGAEIGRLFKHDPTLNTDEMAVHGFSEQIFGQRRVYHYMFNWLVEYPSAHALMMTTVALEHGYRNEEHDKDEKDEEEEENEKDEEENNDEEEEEELSQPRLKGKAVINALFDTPALGRAHVLSAVSNIFELCPDFPTNCLGTSLCFDLFDTHGSLLAERSCNEMQQRLEWLKSSGHGNRGSSDSGSGSGSGRGSGSGSGSGSFSGDQHTGHERRRHLPDYPNFDLSEFEGGILLVKLLQQLDGGCVAENFLIKKEEDGDEDQTPCSGQECMACMSPIVQTLCCENKGQHTKTMHQYLIHPRIPTSSKIQTINIITNLLRLECGTVDRALVKHGLIKGISTIVFAETSSPILLARISKMLMTCLLDKHPETGELLSYRRSKTSRYEGTVRSTLLKTLPSDVVNTMEDYAKRIQIETNGEHSPLSPSSATQKSMVQQNDTIKRMKVHLTRVGNILQVIERQEKKLNNAMLSESKMDLHAAAPDEKYQIGSSLLNNRTWKKYKTQLKQQNVVVFGRECGSWVSNDDDDDYDEGPSSPSTSPINTPPGSPGSPKFVARNILPSTPAQTLVAHDVVEYVMATSLASLGRVARERKEQEDSELTKQTPLSKRAATEMHQDRMAKAQNRFGSKVDDQESSTSRNTGGRRNNNNDEDEAEEYKNTEVKEEESKTSQTSLVSGMVSGMVLPSSFDDSDEDSDDEYATTKKRNILSVEDEEDDEDEMYGRKRK